MIKLRFLRKAICALIIMSGGMFYGCKTNNTDPVPAPVPAPTKTIAQLLATDTTLSIFTGYVNADPTLKGYVEGTAAHTVFAPNNAAFRVLKATLNADLKVIRNDVVLKVLKFHFAKEQKLFNDLLEKSVPTVQGENLTVSAKGTIKEGGSSSAVKIIDGKKDIKATNGVIHMVETILIPPVAVFKEIGSFLGSVGQAVFLTKAFEDIADIIDFAKDNSIKIKLGSSNIDTAYTCFFPTSAPVDIFDLAAKSKDITKELLLSSLKASPATALAFVKNHIFKGSFTSKVTVDKGVQKPASLRVGEKLTNLNGITFTVYDLRKVATDPPALVLSRATTLTELATAQSLPILDLDVYSGGNGSILHVGIIKQ